MSTDRNTANVIKQLHTLCSWNGEIGKSSNIQIYNAPNWETFPIKGDQHFVTCACIDETPAWDFRLAHKAFKEGDVVKLKQIQIDFPDINIGCCGVVTRVDRQISSRAPFTVVFNRTNLYLYADDIVLDEEEMNRRKSVELSWNKKSDHDSNITYRLSGNRKWLSYTSGTGNWDWLKYEYKEAYEAESIPDFALYNGAVVEILERDRYRVRFRHYDNPDHVEVSSTANLDLLTTDDLNKILIIRELKKHYNGLETRQSNIVCRGKNDSKWYKCIPVWSWLDFDYKLLDDLSYKERQEIWIEENKIKVGDLVYVGESGKGIKNGFNGGWNKSMDKYVGLLVPILEITEKGIRLGYNSDTIEHFIFPYSILETLEYVARLNDSEIYDIMQKSIKEWVKANKIIKGSLVTITRCLTDTEFKIYSTYLINKTYIGKVFSVIDFTSYSIIIKSIEDLIEGNCPFFILKKFDGTLSELDKKEPENKMPPWEFYQIKQQEWIDKHKVKVGDIVTVYKGISDKAQKKYSISYQRLNMVGHKYKITSIDPQFITLDGFCNVPYFILKPLKIRKLAPYMCPRLHWLEKPIKSIKTDEVFTVNALHSDKLRLKGNTDTFVVYFDDLLTKMVWIDKDGNETPCGEIIETERKFDGM